MSKYLELFVQQGSFGFVVASHEKANPHWSNKPIKVIDKAALAELERKLAEKDAVISKLKEQRSMLITDYCYNIPELKEECDAELAKLEKGDK